MTFDLIHMVFGTGIVVTSTVFLGALLLLVPTGEAPPELKARLN